MSPSDWTSFAFSAISFLMNDANASGVLLTGSRPSFCNAAFISGLPTALTVAAFSCARMSRGRPAGARSPFQLERSKPGRPDSSSVGTAGFNAERQVSQLEGQRLLVAVFLVKATGGDWDPQALKQR